jgi:hypothetical protein
MKTALIGVGIEILFFNAPLPFHRNLEGKQDYKASKPHRSIEKRANAP